MVANDTAPREAFKMIAEELNAKEIKNKLFLSPLSYTKDEIADGIKNASVVLSGMSARKHLAEMEITACEAAIEAKVPFGFYADTFGAYCRPWFSDLRERASFLFVLNDEEAADAIKLFPNAEIWPFGNPTWLRDFHPKTTRKEVREKLGISEDAKLVLCPGGSSVAINCWIWCNVVDALLRMPNLDVKDWHIIFSVHPTESRSLSRAEIEKRYGDLVQFSRIKSQIITSDMMSSMDLVPACDLVIESSSTIGLAAAYQGKPVICCLNEFSLNLLEDLCGKRSWRPCEWGLSYIWYNPELKSLHVLIKELIMKDKELLKKWLTDIWEKNFPQQNRRVSPVWAMANILSRF